MEKLPKKVIIIGAGPSGIQAGLEFKRLAEKHNKHIEIIILEKDKEVGGKCKTYIDKESGVVTELGACALTSKYIEVLSLMKKYGIELESILPVDSKGLEIKEEYNSLPFLEKIQFMIKLIEEITQFNTDYKLYKEAKESSKKLPDAINKTYINYAKSRNLKYLSMVLKPIVPGFNYGTLEDTHMDVIFEYVRDSIITEVLLMDNLFKSSPMSVVHGGFQALIKKMSESLKDIRCHVEISSIKREKGQVTVTYKQDDKEVVETGDVLVLANSPKNWTGMGLDLTDTESECVKKLESNKYPIAVCAIEGLDPKLIYVKKALEKDGVNHVAFLATRDARPNPKGGRIYTVYISTTPNQDFKFDDKALVEEIQALNNGKPVKVLFKKVWDDYCPRLPWELRLKLEQEQLQKNTIHLGSYIKGSFELVENVIRAAKQKITELYEGIVSYKEGVDWNFFFQKRHKPATESKKYEHIKEQKNTEVITEELLEIEEERLSNTTI